ncbi:DUF6896 domain-containing protein [Rheinheimera baltica]|jgi:hypothetical protein|uniref:DUF6896 domain-containing protein n=1 Tax=Rheinheimera baltica TaxID=67576 RepID=UPI00273D12F1|nr:hypothetical protein [Rheinheimera baltica]MDP5152080.1 hypothetical protein [Rheinheimera baltica]
MTDKDLIKQIIPLWYSSYAWANELLVRVFLLDNANEILSTNYRGMHQIPGTNWFYRTHGVGVDIFKTPEVGGIDFDFGKATPDAWRLKIFFEKQYNDGQLPLLDYQGLADNEDRLEKAIEQALNEHRT